jgi:isopenicillin-N epimerase
MHAHADGIRELWALDPGVTFLNHGSFGACPRVVLDAAQRVRERVEHEPVRFLVGELEHLLDEARAEVAAFVGAQAQDLAWVPNATTGVSTVVRSLALSPGDELLTTDHAYNACRQALEHVAASVGARVVVASVPFPISGPDAVVEAILAHVGPRTRLVLVDQVTSPTALVFPVARIVAELAARGVDTMVDAAHAPGMVPLELDRTGAAYTTGNFHKWLCTPKVAAFLHVRRDRQAQIHPLATSHGRSSPRTDRSRFLLEHDWTGTFDPAPFLCVPVALRFLREHVPGGLAGWMGENHEKAVAARALLSTALGVEPPCPDAMLGAMASVILPWSLPDPDPPVGPFDPLQEALFERYGIEVPIFPFPPRPRKLMRVSTPAYVTLDDVRKLAKALGDLRPFTTGV